MFSALGQALGLDFTFFIQLGIFLLMYPIITRFLLPPYIALQNQREKDTIGKEQEAKELKEKEGLLKLNYQQKAKEVSFLFNKKYGEQSLLIKSQLLKEEQEKEKKIRAEFAKTQANFKQDMIVADQALAADIPQLTQIAIKSLLKIDE